MDVNRDFGVRNEFEQENTGKNGWLQDYMLDNQSIQELVWFIASGWRDELKKLNLAADFNSWLFDAGERYFDFTSFIAGG